MLYILTKFANKLQFSKVPDPRLCVNQRLGISLNSTLLPNFFFFIIILGKHVENTEKGVLGQCLECAAPKCWSKYTTGFYNLAL